MADYDLCYQLMEKMERECSCSLSKEAKIAPLFYAFHEPECQYRINYEKRIEDVKHYLSSGID